MNTNEKEVLAYIEDVPCYSFEEMDNATIESALLKPRTELYEGINKIRFSFKKGIYIIISTILFGIPLIKYLMTISILSGIYSTLYNIGLIFGVISLIIYGVFLIVSSQYAERTYIQPLLKRMKLSSKDEILQKTTETSLKEGSK